MSMDMFKRGLLSVRDLMRMPVLCLLLVFAPLSVAYATDSDVQQPQFDVKKLIFDHIKDSYEWHITTWGEKHISIYLPVILYSERTGWELFSSEVFHHNKEYNGFHLCDSGNNEGKIVEYDADGNEVRPFIDISITKTVFSVFINAVLLLAVVFGVAYGYKRRRKAGNDYAPRGFSGAFEMLVVMVVDDIAKPNIGRCYKRYVPFLLTTFLFIFISNLMGLLPMFPGGSNVTGNIAVTMVLAFCTFLAVNLFANKEYWKEIFWPDVPWWLKVPVPLMPFIELFGVFTKPFVLMIRLFANILAGHTVVLAFISIIFVTMAVNVYIGSAMTLLSVLLTVFISFLELLVAFIQAFVFTMLSAVFIGMSQPEEHSVN